MYAQRGLIDAHMQITDINLEISLSINQNEINFKRSIPSFNLCVVFGFVSDTVGFQLGKNF